MRGLADLRPIVVAGFPEPGRTGDLAGGEFPRNGSVAAPATGVPSAGARSKRAIAHARRSIF